MAVVSWWNNLMSVRAAVAAVVREMVEATARAVAVRAKAADLAGSMGCPQGYSG